MLTTILGTLSSHVKGKHQSRVPHVTNHTEADNHINMFINQTQTMVKVTIRGCTTRDQNGLPERIKIISIRERLQSLLDMARPVP